MNTKANTPINFCFSFSNKLIKVLVNSDGTLYAYKPLASSKTTKDNGDVEKCILFN